jgi:hypothetical protein
MDINTLEEKLGIANLSNAEKLALVKGIESNVQASKAAVKAQEAGQYASLVVDAIKRIKNDLETRFNELNGIIDVKAKTLTNGKDGLQGAKGEKGDQGFDGVNGKDGYNGKDGIDGVDGKDGVGVQDAYIDFDGSLVIKLTDGRELNVGEVVPMEIAEKIKVIGNGGGTSQSVLDAIAALQAVDATYGTMATQNANAVAITGGSINGTVIGGTTPAAGTFTTLGITTSINASGAGANVDLNVNSKGTGNVNLGTGNGTALVVADNGSSTGYFRVFPGTTTVILENTGAQTNINSQYRTKGTGNHDFNTGGTFANTQVRVAHTASAVNYVQVTGAATGAPPAITVQGSDSNIRMNISSKGTESVDILTNNTGTRAARFAHTASAVNYLQTQGSVAGNGLQFSAQGSDTNISQVFQSKGTGAIDLAAGSSGVNISNGGTVTAITLTASGSGYTSAPTVVISAPTTANGVQATATIPIMVNTVTVVAGGTGYTVGDTLTAVGGTFTSPVVLTVSTVSSGVITAVTTSGANRGNYTIAPSNPVSVTGGTGSGATFTLVFIVASNTPFTITNAGSGYVEQPTVTFSGGGGSGAAAYATVGSIPTIKSINTSVDFYGASNGGSNVLRLLSSSSTSNATNTTVPAFALMPSQANFGTNALLSSSQVYFITSATGSGFTFQTGSSNPTTTGTAGTSQFVVAHTASAVNYVQVTGAATGSGPTISAQGSNADIDLNIAAKGTGNVRFGTYTAGVLTPTGYITIKDSGGTTRRLLVG